MEAIPIQPAPLWRRLAAIVYDAFLVMALAFLAAFINLGIQMMIFGQETLKTMTEQGHSVGGLPFSLAVIAIIFGFFGFFWTRTGQTLGMQAWRIRIQTHEGSTLSPKQCVIRFVVAIPSLLLAGLGVFWVLIDKKKRSWQDMASGSNTVVIAKAKKKS